MKVDFSNMTKAEIRDYLVKHPSDKSAFEAFVNTYTAEATSTTYPMAESPEAIQEVENLIRQKVTQPESD
ncbi:MAG: hypothetical protein ACFCU5_17770 [Pleurocapsa sp.]